MSTSEEILRRLQIKTWAEALISAAEAAPSGLDLLEECLSVAEMLVRKNTEYGDSALNPVRIFSKASLVEQIRVRMDDKVNRLMKGQGGQEDTVGDLLGYIVLLRIAERRAQKEGMEEALDGYSPYLSGDVRILLEDSKPYERDFRESDRSISATAEDLLRENAPPASGGIKACQECGGKVEENVAVCDVCYRRRFGRDRLPVTAGV